MLEPSRADVLRAASTLYGDVPLAARILQSARPRICPFERLLPHIPAGARVLDVGCGAGLLLSLIAYFDPLARGVGFDTNARSLAVARRAAQHPAVRGRLDFEQRSATAEWPEGRYDVVSLIDVLHHVPLDAQALVVARALERVRPGGLLLYKDMTDRPVWQAGWNRLHDLLLAGQWIHYRPVAQVAAWVARAGALAVADARIDLGPYGHEMLVARCPG